MTNFAVFGLADWVEGGDGQLIDGLGGRLAELVQAVAGFQRHAQIRFRLIAAFALGDVQVLQHLIAQAALVKLGNVFREQLDGGVNLPVQRRFVAQHFVELVNPLVFGECGVLEKLGLPAVQAAQTPGGRRDFLDVMLL